MKLLYLALFLLLLIGCKTTDVPLVNVENKSDLHFELECYKNAMPMSDGGSYVVITGTTTDSTIQENLKVIELTAIGENGTWKADNFDNSEFKGNGLVEYRNIARNFDPTIGSIYDFKLMIQYESGLSKTYEINAVSIQTVH